MAVSIRVFGLAVALLVIGTAGCDSPSALPPPNPDTRPATDGPQAKLPTPILDRGRIPGQTCELEVGISGRATPGVSLIITGGAAASGVIGSANVVDGRFCVPIKLQAKRANQIQVVAQDEVLGLSDAATITVIQEDCSGGGGEFKDGGVTDGGGTPSHNVALGALGKARDVPDKGNLGFLTDGKISSWVSWSGAGLPCNWCDYKGWVMITLDELVEIQRIVIKWRDSEGNGTDYGKEYKILYTAVTEPPDPNLDDGYWVVAKDITEGLGGVDLHDLKSIKPIAKHVALWLLQDAYPWSKEFTGEEVFAIAEIEVWDAPKGTGPPPPPPSPCSGF